MNILLSNDDGYSAPGINVLRDVLLKKHRIFLIAPDRNRSAISHGITMFNGLVLHQYEKDLWSCSGTPADCVVLALKSGFINEKIDLVISGINAGPNLGTDIIYSGTCAASREAVLAGCPSIALSLDVKEGEKPDFLPLARLVEKNLEYLMGFTDGNKKKCFVNLNAKNLSEKCDLREYKGLKYSDLLSVRKYRDKMSFKKEGENIIASLVDTSPLEKAEKFSDAWYSDSGYAVFSSVPAAPYALPFSSFGFSDSSSN